MKSGRDSPRWGKNQGISEQHRMLRSKVAIFLGGGSARCGASWGVVDGLMMGGGGGESSEVEGVDSSDLRRLFERWGDGGSRALVRLLL